MGKECVIHGCTNRDTKRLKGVKFHRIPTAEPRRSMWIKAINRKDYNTGKHWSPGDKTARICSQHFIQGKSDDPNSPDYVPSVNLGYKTSNTPTKATMDRYNRASARSAGKERPAAKRQMKADNEERSRQKQQAHIPESAQGSRMAASDHSLHPILMFVTDQQEIRIRQLFQQSGWTCQLKVLTSRHLNIIKTPGDSPTQSTLYTVPVDRNVLDNFNEFEFGRENGEKRETGTDVYRDERHYDGKVSEQACSVENVDYSHIFVKTEQNENTIGELGTDSSERHEVVMEHDDYVVVKNEAIDDGYGDVDVSDKTLQQVESPTGDKKLPNNTDTPILSDMMKRRIEGHGQANGNDGNNTTTDQHENTHIKMEEDQSKVTQQKQDNDKERIRKTIGERIPKIVEVMIPKHVEESIPKTVAAMIPKTVAVIIPKSVAVNVPKSVAIIIPKAVGERLTQIAEEKKPVDIYHDPFVERLMKYLQSSEMTRPVVTSLMLRSCCMFLLEKDQSFVDWCKSKIDFDKSTDWKTRILEIALKSDQVLLDVCIDRLKHIVEASVNPGFVDYLSNFLVTAKQLSFENTTAMELTYQDVATTLLNKHLIGEPSTDFLSNMDITCTSIPYNLKLAGTVDGKDIGKEQCQYCTRKIPSHSMEYHVNRLHPEHTTNQCFTCKALFSSRRELEQHGRETKHRTQFPVECPICSKKLANKSVVTAHLRYCHGKDTEPHVCDVCGKVFKSELHMRNHRIRHTGARHKFKCEKCGKGFISRHYLAMHKRVHSGERPFKCPHCDYRCAFPNNLPIHIKKHEKDGTEK